jgi:long-chain acyl-CoA synthetase
MRRAFRRRARMMSAKPSRTADTLAVLPFDIADRSPYCAVLRQCRGDAIIAISGRELLEQIRDVSFGLCELGLSAGDRVAVIAESRPEWCVADLAVLAAGGVTVPVYPTLTASQIHHILTNCGASIAVVSNRTQLDKIVADPALRSGLVSVIVMDADGRPWPRAVTPLADVAACGHTHLAADPGASRMFEQRARAVTRDALATIIYTSGTTGAPKGAMLTHGNLLSNVDGPRRSASQRGYGVVVSATQPRVRTDGALCISARARATLRVAWTRADMVKVRPTLATAVP